MSSKPSQRIVKAVRSSEDIRRESERLQPKTFPTKTRGFLNDDEVKELLKRIQAAAEPGKTFTEVRVSDPVKDRTEEVARFVETHDPKIAAAIRAFYLLTED